MIVYILLSIGLISHVSCKAPQCCSTVKNEECRTACFTLTTAGNQREQMEHLLDVSKSCHGDQIEFWQCVNQTVQVVHSLAVWSGRPCCDLAKNRVCEQACREAKSQSEIKKACMESLETHLYECVKKQREGEICCSTDEDYSCRITCQGTFLANYNRKNQRHTLRTQCRSTNTIMQCVISNVEDFKVIKLIDHLPCCYQIENQRCRETCERTLSTMTDQYKIAGELENICGPIFPQHPPWSCFLSQPPHKKVEEITMDYARLQCCSKASNDRCRTLCTSTYSSDWQSHYSEFQSSCQDLTLPVSRMEAPMLTCITDAYEPCKLGCDGLDFCTNFNNRPTSLFRACSKQSDNAARAEFQSWLVTKRPLSPQLQIPVKDINTCEPEMWKAIACAMQVKPCGRKPASFVICRDDCEYLLNKCLNTSAIHPSQSVSHLCKLLSPDDTARSCISIKQFTERSPFSDYSTTDLTTPCNPNPCDADEVCWNNHRKCRHPENCPAYVCHKACSMGIDSAMAVPKHVYIRIPNTSVSDSKSDSCVKQQICRCGNKKLENCRSIPCTKQDKCHLGGAQGGISKNHGEHFRIDCNFCICHSGELVCTKGRCPSGNDDSTLTGLSCDCPHNYHPVCGDNGKTYPNSCLAKRCGGLRTDQIRQGACRLADPCRENPCGNSFRCLPKPQVCLHIARESCLQYECVPHGVKCNAHYHDPVCDTEGTEHTNACLLLKKGKTLAYRGHCQTHCSTTSPVCGHDGETYTSQCQALAARVTVDYQGPCRVVGHFSGNMSSGPCPGVSCDPVLPPQCKPILPPGACCPVCAAELRVLYKPELAEMVSREMMSGPLSVQQTVDILSHNLEILECDVFGFLGVDQSEVVILIKPVTATPTMLQVQACIREAERIEYLVQTDSPLLKAYATLTPFLLAPMRAPSTIAVSSSGALNSSFPLLSVLIILTLFTLRTFNSS
ncbi:reversion-inducing cysteine-rich protein with Kazal motifs-like [Saccostrea echinata]|uniref:reversion-inducing cysteine-rich protein with Kazal motifs-like n=1 Tax=Saccostrea echinata TaxID=191078 RepID=UPI002A800E78|nr:reversion-inducing cysteine-rich protein with Kazal motifs-like [Saccostrea echinata]